MSARAGGASARPAIVDVGRALLWLVAASIAGSFSGACGSSSNAGSDGAPRDAAVARSRDASGDRGNAEGGIEHDGGGDAKSRLPRVFGGKRPMRLDVPSSYDPKRAYPLVVLLHGFGANGALQKTYLGYAPLFEREGFLLAAPDGTQNAAGVRFWNATRACCAYGATVDDVSYLQGLIRAIDKAYHVDRRRIFLVGHSNGGFMSYRLACEMSGQIAALVSLAGAMLFDETRCRPSSPVSVLQVHGTLDAVVHYGGGQLTLDPQTKYPSAKRTVTDWARYDHCRTTLVDRKTSYDIDATLTTAETHESSFDGCPAGISVSLWTMNGIGHLPNLTSGRFAELTWRWLEAHPKP